MTIVWSNLAIGSIVGAILGVVGDWRIGTKLRKRSELRGTHERVWFSGWPVRELPHQRGRHI